MAHIDVPATAERVAQRLIAELKGGVIPKIDIDLIETRCDAVIQPGAVERERLVAAATRRVVELAA